jgi:DNA (cytosine-5)-methyltransferase 1
MERGIHFATILASLAELDYAIEWRLLNAMDFGLPQNRHRVFIVGVRHPATRSGSSRVQPHRIRLANVDDFRKSRLDLDELSSIDTWPDISAHGTKFPNWGMAGAGRFHAIDLHQFSAKRSPVLLRSVMETDVAAEFDFTESTVERLRTSKPVRKFVAGVEILSNQQGGARMGYTVFGTRGVAPTLTSTASRHYERYKVGSRYRRLTNIEYARIQGFPDDHCSAMSTYDQYALFGNAVPPPMVEWVVRQLLSSGLGARDLPRGNVQRKLFIDA